MAYAGRTTAPCEGCGKKPDDGRYGREKGKVCAACQALMDDGRRARAATQAAASATAERPWRWPGSYYDVEIGFHAPHDERDAVGRAFVTLVELIAPPAPPGTALVSHRETRDGRDPFTHRKRKEVVDVLWPWLFDLDAKRAGEKNYYYRDLEHHRMLRPDVREALEALRRAVHAAIDGAYLAGKEYGGSALRRLAAGDITVGQYDDSLVSDEELARRRR